MIRFLKSSKVSKIVDNPDVSTNPISELASKRTWAKSLSLTRSKLGQRLAQIFSSNGPIDDDLFERLETILITSDIGVTATEQLIANTKSVVKRDKLQTRQGVKAALKSEMLHLLQRLCGPVMEKPGEPYVILIAGVNGAGKTTTIGKLTKKFTSSGKTVLLAAGDTFRAAAEEQIKIWGVRNQVSVVSQENGDSAAVIYDAIQSARSKHIDVVLADTAGRLPTQKHLMAELEKVKRVMGKALDTSPNEVMLVIDANTGQNAIEQVKSFDRVLGIDSIVLTKLDGTAKGGCLFGIADYRAIPVRYIGTGEGIDDLQPFAAREFIDAMFIE
ncbi:MAG: signal recognition particle-docking protein FtsY [Proteobacteria bacterium]|nr:signal recognition particle-docking protein FtsY [Pseudomonadota bacterium]MDA1332014.1 signal recognition particle-docking protein FtsY [Pseudomonadota bacterium]